jgi:hypothetical protein
LVAEWHGGANAVLGEHKTHTQQNKKMARQPLNGLGMTFQPFSNSNGDRMQQHKTGQKTKGNEKNLPLRSAFSATDASSLPRQDSRLRNQDGWTQKLRLHGATKRIQTLSVLAHPMLRLLCMEGIIARCRLIVGRVARTAAERA